MGWFTFLAHARVLDDERRHVFLHLTHMRELDLYLFHLLLQLLILFPQGLQFLQLNTGV